jgi:hypothetical protein
MVPTRLAAAWLFVTGIVWLLVAVWVMLVMGGIATPAVAVWLLLVMFYVAPLALIVGSALVFARRCSRVGVIIALLACAWLTWIIGSDLWPRKPENDAIAPMHYDWLSVALALVVVLSDLAAVLMWRTNHLTRRCSEPLADPSSRFR